MNNQEEWKKINAIVDKALDLEDEERLQYIEEQCEGDEELEQQVKELLRSIEQSATEEFLEKEEAFPSHLAADFSSEVNKSGNISLIGETIDRYKIIDLIGHGGMGSVFLAERADDVYKKQVAIKLMRRGMDTPSNIKRFNRERQILATLDHPNVARLLDGGVTEDGLPYLVMEYVDGIPLYDFCDKHKLTVDERLELFKSICKAVQHAHTNAIIHRDLKPSNILVTDDGTVKVLDFGIAKLMKPMGAGNTLFETRTGARMLTLSYAAPEQVDSRPVTTASDTHNLGILLYELLVGLHPFEMDSKEKSVVDAERKIREVVPELPARKLESLANNEQQKIADKRGTSPSTLYSTIIGDLDAISMKALRKEPEARYATVDQILKDLYNYEHSLPLLAKRDSLKYRTEKFLKRHRNAVVGIVLFLLAILGFGSYHINQITKERNIAETEAQKAQTVKDFLIEIFRSSNPQSLAYQGKDVSARTLLLSGQKDIAGKFENQPSIYVEVMTAIGDALKGINALEEAKESYRKALDRTSEIDDSQEYKTRLYVKLGQLESMWRRSDEVILNLAQKARKLLEKVDNPPSSLEASVHNLLGKANIYPENFEIANSHYKKADSIYTSAGLTDSFEYIQMLNGYGKSLIYESNFRKAEQILQRSNKLHREIYSKPTMTIADNYKFLGWANRDMGNFQKSNEHFKKSIELNKQLAGEESISTALSMHHLAINYFLSGDFEKSEQVEKEVLNIFQKLFEPSNDHMNRAKKYIAIAKYNQNQLYEAKKLLHEIIDSRTKYKGEDNFNLAGPLSYLGMVNHKQGNTELAISQLEKSIRIYKKRLSENSSRVARAKIKLATVYRDIGKYETSEKYFKQVKAIHQKVLPENNHQQGDFYLEYGKLKLEMGNRKEARKYLEKAYAIYLNLFGKDSNRTKTANSYLSNSANALNK